MEEFDYDRNNRIKYDPAIHHNHGKPYTVSELEYLCKFYETDGRRSVSLILGRTESTIAEIVRQLRRNGKFEYYKNLNKNW